MTSHRSFKHLVRTRMEKTGESNTRGAADRRGGAEAQCMKAFWRERVAALTELLEG